MTLLSKIFVVEDTTFGKCKIDGCRCEEVDVIDVAILTDTDRDFPLTGMLKELASLGRFIENVQCTPEGG